MDRHSVDVAPFRFSTEDLPERDRLGIYREHFGRTLFRLDIEPVPDLAFRSDVTMHALPGVAISSHTGGGFRAWRTPELISDARDEYLLIANLKGPSVIAQRRREFTIEERGATLVTLDEVGGVIHPTLDHHHFVLNMPRAAIAPFVRHAEDALMRPIPREQAALRLLIKYIALLQDGEVPLEAPLRPLVAGHIHHLVAAAIGATRDAMEVARGGIRAARLATIRADVLANLSDRRLSAKTIGERHGVSDRYVHLLFAETGQNFSRFVEEERLQRAFALLSDPAHALKRIQAIATEVGFAEHSTFDRAFRRRFGDTPSGARRGRVDRRTRGQAGQSDH